MGHRTQLALSTIRRLARWVVRALTIGSAVLCLLFIALAIRSYFVADSFQNMWFQREHVEKLAHESDLPPLLQRSWFVMHGKGSLCICRNWMRTDFSGQPGQPPGGMQFYRQHDVALPSLGGDRSFLASKLGFDFCATNRENYQFYGIVLPYWTLILLTAPWPALSARRWRRNRRRQRWSAQGHCPACGYDLRATPDRCPECGNPTPPVSPKTNLTN